MIKQNAFFFILLALLSWASGTSGGLAWEAHLGGFLFGLCVGPTLLPPSHTEMAGAKPDATERTLSPQ
jgi:membrane associated rhomboid family serine protease